MMVQEQMTHGPATGDGHVFSFVGEDMGSVCLVGRANVDPLSRLSSLGALLSIREIKRASGLGRPTYQAVVPFAG